MQKRVDINESGLPSAKVSRMCPVIRKSVTNVSCHPQKASNSTIWGGTNRSSLRNARRRRGDISAQLGGAWHQGKPWAMRARQGDTGRAREPKSAGERRVGRLNATYRAGMASRACFLTPRFESCHGLRRRLLSGSPQTPQKCDGISGDQTTCSQPLPMRVQAATVHSRNRGV
jgi:hypothetical protein